MPFALKKIDNLFAGFSNKPKPITSPMPFHSGLVTPFGNSKSGVSPEKYQSSSASPSHPH
jgi:hypothetical protein